MQELELPLLEEYFPFKYSIVENSTNGKMILEGVCQRVDTPNQNKRIYPYAIFERIFLDENINSAISDRRVFGHLNHPKPGEDPNDLERAAILLINHRFAENKKDIIGQFEVLDTPKGQIVRKLCEANCTIGISSRGSGSVKKNAMGLDEVGTDYVFSTYDIVANPSTHRAFVRPSSSKNEEVTVEEILKQIDDKKEKTITTNNLEENKENKLMLAQEKFSNIEQKALDFLKIDSASVNESLKSVIESMGSNLIVDLTKFGNETPEFKGLTESLVSDLSTKRKELRAVAEAFPPNFKKKGKEDDEDEDDKKEKKEVKEATKGTIDKGIRRSVDYEAKPAPGEGWPLNVKDAGVLSGINAGISEYMENETEFENVDEVEEAEEKEMKDDEEDEKDESVTDSLISIAEQLISIPETENNSVARAFAAAFLMENSARQSENAALSQVIEKMKEKFATFQESYESDLKENNEILAASLEELKNRHRLLSAKVYAEEKLSGMGLRNHKDAVKEVSEVVASTPTKTAIDEVLSKVQAKYAANTVDESKAKNLEGALNNLTESAVAKSKPRTSLYEGAELGKKLSEKMRAQSQLK